MFIALRVSKKKRVNVKKIEVQIEKIKEIKDKNLITEEEYQNPRSKTLEVQF